MPNNPKTEDKRTDDGDNPGDSDHDRKKLIELEPELVRVIEMATD